MSTELLDPKQFAENLRGKVKQEYVNLIPEEKWDAFIAETVNDFREKELKKVVVDELTGWVKQQVKNYLSDKSYTHWDNEKQRSALDDELIKGIETLAPQIFTSMIQGAVQYALQNMRNGLGY